jgi:hypothetical protein
MEEMSAGSAANSVTFLAAPGAGREDPFGLEHAWGIAVWNAAAQSVHIRFAGLPPLDPDRDYQCWIVGPDPGLPVSSILRSNVYDDSYALAVHLRSPAPPGYRILLIDGAKGGAATLEEAKARGSIILASPPQAGKISN